MKRVTAHILKRYFVGGLVGLNLLNQLESKGLGRLFKLLKIKVLQNSKNTLEKLFVDRQARLAEGARRGYKATRYSSHRPNLVMNIFVTFLNVQNGR